jgi:predicted DNA-binding ribbon-helix-helix protein
MKPAPESALIRKTVALPSGRTSFKLEPEFWDALNEAAAEREFSRSEMITLIVANRQGNVASMLRVWCLKEAKARADGLAAARAMAARPAVVTMCADDLHTLKGRH